MVETARYLPPDVADELTGELVCYGRSVVGVEWTALDAGELDDSVNPWGAAMYRTISTVGPQTEVEQSAYDRWMDQTADREQSRTDRVHGAQGVIPLPLWLVLYLIVGVIFVFMLFFADRAERAATQAVLMGSVTTVITVLMLLLAFSTTRTATESAGYNQRLWSGPFARSMPSWKPSASRSSLRAVGMASDSPMAVRSRHARITSPRRKLLQGASSTRTSGDDTEDPSWIAHCPSCRSLSS